MAETNWRQIREIEAILQEHMELYGYSLIDVPVIAPAEIFLTRAGDTIIEELFTFERFGNLLALRPEFTAAAAYHYVQENLSGAVRWQLSGTVFIDDPADISSQYQKHTIGAELIGQNGTMADAEIMAIATQGMGKIGQDEWSLVTGHVGLQLHLLSQFNLDSRTYRILLTQRDRLREHGIDAVLDYLSTILAFETDASNPAGNGTETQQVLDVLLDSTRYGSTMGGRNRHDIAARLLKKHDRGLERQQIVNALEFLQIWGTLRGTPSEILPEVQSLIHPDDKAGQALFAEWQETIAYLDAYGISETRIILQPDLTKNWDYYTGIVFGIHANGNYVASGGRYDGLTKLLGSEESFPSVGFAYFTDNLIGTHPDTHETLTVSGRDAVKSIQWASALRDAGISAQLVDTDSDIVVDDVATYDNKTFDLEELIRELQS